MGVAVALLFIAIVLRVVRRIRGGGPTSEDDDPGGPAPPDEPTGEAADEPRHASPARAR
jgi:hypothetical protein